MTRIRKQKKRKTFNRNINRKRLRNRLSNLGPIQCDPVKKAWNRHLSTKKNLKRMGLVYDPNVTFKIPSYREVQKERAVSILQGNFTVTEDDAVRPTIPTAVETKESGTATKVSTKTGVISELEAIAKAPRTNKFRLPNSHVEYIVYFIDKYGNDFKAMAKDRRNYNQETWRQLRSKVKKFMTASKQYGKYLQSRGKLHEDLNEEDLKKEAEAFEIDSD